MCGRFTQRYTWSEVLEFMRVFGPDRNLQPRYSIAPTMTVDVIRLDESGNRELVPMRWGLIPAWWVKSLKEIPATFNAHAESVADKPMFRDAFRGKRCIIPASGFYEWTGDKGNKQPHLFTAANGSPILAFAGLWDRWRRRGHPLMHDHRVRGEQVDADLPRPHARHPGREEFRRLA
jgi:putative SOS response-associated peptidase YedK